MDGSAAGGRRGLGEPLGGGARQAAQRRAAGCPGAPALRGAAALAGQAALAVGAGAWL